MAVNIERQSMIEPVVCSGNTVKKMTDMLLLLRYLLRFQFRLQSYYIFFTCANLFANFYFSSLAYMKKKQ